MKKYFKLLLVAVVLGSLLSLLFFKNIQEEVKAITNKNYEITLFQVGVFKQKENALDYSKTFDYSYIYEDSGYYRVIIAIGTNEIATSTLEEYFKSKEIDYYLKKVTVNKNVYNELNNYATLISNTKNIDVIDTINKSMLDIFKE